ncbi:MAG: DEAD/DEAH box helicase family protein [Planctomycetes bacterium]|nr:DEAD/DEAH box helicase family protein [Planctomycetota bacterium]
MESAISPGVTQLARLSFTGGTLVLEGAPAEVAAQLPAHYDPRIEAWRLPASSYHLVIRFLVAAELPFDDRARGYEELELVEGGPQPRDYQAGAIEAWVKNHRRGVVALPTGSGKTLVAHLAIERCARSALIVVPTIDLLNQWFDGLAERFGEELIGAIGGGAFEVRPLTVITYDSAYLHLDRLGNKFGLLICDEAHHLPGPSYVQIARMALAPFRLGLTATPPEGERLDVLEQALGPIVFSRAITDLAGQYLADYETIHYQVELSESERADYLEANGRYRQFVSSRGIRLGGSHGWARFLAATNESEEGRQALRAWRRQREISLATPKKLDLLEEILARHPGERVLVFTYDNASAYAVSRRFLVPAITHQTKPRERRAILAGLRSGEVPVLVTARVLNEGVDLPEVAVGVVLSGTATVREHVQRLGRILRRQEGKHAILYELVTKDTSEVGASARRRDHVAYRPTKNEPVANEPVVDAPSAALAEGKPSC